MAPPSTLADALRISCNTAFAQLGLSLGAKALQKQAQAFGIGAEPSFELSVARSIFPETLDAPQTALSSIGQYDVALTPLQAAMIVAGIANHGMVMKPRLVDETRRPDLSVLDKARSEVMSTAMTRSVADQLTQMMQLVVASGTGTAAQISGVAVAGKTGTAQHATGAAPHAWFGGFAPAGSPKVAVAVVIEDGGNLGKEGTGGTLAAPVARAVMQAALSAANGG